MFLASQLKKQKLVASYQHTHRSTTTVLEHTQICSNVLLIQAICTDRPLFQNALLPDPRTLILVLQILAFYMSRGHIIRITESHSLAIILIGMVELPVVVRLFLWDLLPSSCEWNMGVLWVEYGTGFLHDVIFWYWIKSYFSYISLRPWLSWIILRLLQAKRMHRRQLLQTSWCTITC